jgi:hypothetical protein
MRGHVIVGVMTISTDVDKLYDTDLSDAGWALIAPMLPAARPGGRPRKINIRAVLNAIFYRWPEAIVPEHSHCHC